jgi:uncharacterized membrane protein
MNHNHKTTAMDKPTSTFDMEALVGTILLVGVLTSMVLIVIGVIWNRILTSSFAPDYSITGVNFFGFLIDSIRELFSSSGIHPRQLISLGIVTLLLTPFLRVAASFLYFLLAERNWKFSVITLIVLGVLTYSLFLR